VQLKVPASSVENVVTAIRDNQDPKTLRVKVSDDGRLRARIPSTARHGTPTLTGQLEADGDSVTPRGVIREPAAAVARTPPPLSCGLFFEAISPGGIN